MTDAAGYSRKARIYGWGIALAYLAHQFVTIRLPRTDRTLPLREELRGWHYAVGTLLLVLVILRLVEWARERGRVGSPAGLPDGAFRWGRTLALASYILFAAAPLLGVVWAWTSGYPLHLGPTPALPNPIGESRTLWMFSGYFHSGMGFMLLVLNLLTLLTGGWFALRYGRGLLAGLPPGFGAQALIGMTFTVYALSTFRSPEPGPRNVAIFLALVAAVWLLARLLGRGTKAAPAGGPHSAPAGTVARVASPVVVVVAIGAAAYLPHGFFGVTPWPMGEAVEARGGETWHTAQATQVTFHELTPAQRAAAQETYKWCRFCHTVDAGKDHLVGPNLHLIWGQKAGTTPGFHYSDAMVEARGRGLVWTDATIASYIADPQRFMPGTTMVISSGPVSDPEVRRAVVELLKRETMPGAPVD